VTGSAEDAGAIAGIRCRLHTVPLLRPWGPDVLTLSIIEVTVATEDGRTGTGFSWTPSIGASAVVALLEDDIARFAVGADADPEALWPRLWAHLHEAGGGGITTIAMAGLDLALWDLRARSAGRSISALLGERRSSVAVYGSGVNLHYSIDELADQAARWVAAGFGAVKIKVGKPGLAEDVERVAAVREVIGADRELMIDANQRWDLPTATRAIEALSAFGLRWIEEPLLSDDLAAHTELRRRTSVPVALGENLHTIHRFIEAMDGEACDVVQPNVIRVGGITAFRAIAGAADDRGVALYPHLLPELSGQLALTLTNPTMVEEVEDASFEQLGLLADASPVSIVDGTLRSTEHDGLGFEFSGAGAVARR
jgi:L-alanine-DL-glutamate epimerase-like enolase superfamily enzyme